MIALQHNSTGEVQFVFSTAGIDMAVWTEVDAATAGLPNAKALQRAAINRARDAAIDGGAATPAGDVDTSLQSRILIAGAVQTALIAASQSQPFAIDWTMADNSVAQLDGPGMIGVGLAVAAHVDAIHQRARVLKGRIDAAATLGAVQDITWTLVDP